MKSRWLALVSVIAVIFCYVAVVSQFYDNNSDQYRVFSITAFGFKQQQLVQRTNILDFDSLMDPSEAMCRKLDLMLPKDARVFVNDMLGPTNRGKVLTYHYLTYYLFPREIAVSMDQPGRVTKNGFMGQPAGSDQEILTNGFNVIVDTKSGVSIKFQNNLALNQATTPDWFRNPKDCVIAFAFPLLTALTGLWLVVVLFPGLSERMGPLEKLACGFGLGMMAVAALTLGVKLCGFQGYRWVFVATGAGALLVVWNNRRAFWMGTKAGLLQAVQSPVVLTGGLVFFLVFWAAGVWGLTESDAVCAWMLKAKIFHLCTGGDIVRWFSEPRLAHAHMDYPTLVPALHAATYDSLGHLNECVTKFWPAWTLLLLLGAVASLNRGCKGWVAAPQFLLLALAVLPATRLYSISEGGTMPMAFFTALGFLQCALWQVEKDHGRLWLGLTLFFGAAMAKFEGFIILAVVVSWILLMPSARPSWKGWTGLVRMLAFWLVAALPFIWLRARIPVLHYESGWAGYALRNPWTTVSHWPGILMMILSRWFFSHDFAAWNGESGYLHYVGKWQGFSSLYNHPTLGLAWVNVLMTVALWYTVPARRKLILWMVAVIFSMTAAFSLVFASFVSITNLAQVIEYTEEITAARYLFPMLIAWSVTSLTLLFASQFAESTVPEAGTTLTGKANPAPVRPKNKSSLPVAKK